MLPPPETILIQSERVACDGSGAVPAALGHPRVYLHVDADLGYVDCGYCDRRFILEGGPADTGRPPQ
jgi:NADH dehydrogenase (ubiquinone) Fe-S protein 6